MMQSRVMSLVEAIANVVVGYGVAVMTQLVVFPWFALPARVDDALAIGAIFSVVSVARGFAIRRAFEKLRRRRMPQHYETGTPRNLAAASSRSRVTGETGATI